MKASNSLRRTFSLEEARAKAQKFCAYQERCIYDLDRRLKEWQVQAAQRDIIIDEMVEQHFIDEKRFVSEFVRGKFNQKGWGRIKIRAELKKRSINEELITEGLNRLSAGDYRKKLKAVLQRKKETMGARSDSQWRSKLYYQVLSRGFESGLIGEVMQELWPT